MSIPKNETDFPISVEQFNELTDTSIPLVPLKQRNLKSKDERFKAKRKAIEQKDKREARRVPAKVASINNDVIMVDEQHPAKAPVKNKSRRRRLAKAAVKLKEQMARLKMPANALQRVVALYQAACKYECAVQPKRHPALALEPVYLPRPVKYRMNGNGQPKLDRKGNPIEKKAAWRLVEYKLVPRNPGVLFDNVKMALSEEKRELLKKEIEFPKFAVENGKVFGLNAKGVRLFESDPDGHNVILLGNWFTPAQEVTA